MVYYNTAVSAHLNIANITLDFEDQTLHQKISTSHILKLAKHHPQNMQAQCYACLNYLLNPQCHQQMTPYLNQAEKIYFQNNAELQLLYHGIYSWAHHNIDEAISIFTAASQIYPNKLIYPFIVNHLITLSGQPSHLNRTLTLNKTLQTYTLNHPYKNIFNALSLLQNQQLSEAEHILKKNHHHHPMCNPTLFNLSLSLYLQQNFDQAIRALESHPHIWKESKLDLQLQRLLLFISLNLINQHKHQANAHYQQALKISTPTTHHDVYLISMLWRMQLAGINIEPSMQTLVESFKNRAFEFHTPLSAAHYAYAYSIINKHSETQEMISIHQFSLQQMPGKTAKHWQQHYPNFINGVISFARKNYSLALQQLQPFLNNKIWLNGNHIQTEILYQAWVYCLFQERKPHVAKTSLNQFLPHFHSTPLHENWLRLRSS